MKPEPPPPARSYQAEQSVKVRYVMTHGARRVVATATGSLDPDVAPRIPDLPCTALVPAKGDIVQFEETGDEEFLVLGRVYRFKGNSVEIDLCLESCRLVRE